MRFEVAIPSIRVKHALFSDETKLAIGKLVIGAMMISSVLPDCRTLGDACFGTVNFAKIFKAVVFRQAFMAVVGR